MSTLITGEAVALDVRPASLAARAASCAIDVVVYGIIYTGYFIAVTWLLNKTGTINNLLAGSLVTASIVITLVGVPCVIELLTRGRSVGKLAVGLRIVRDDGGAISFRHSLLRALMWQFEVLSFGGGIAALSGLLSPQTKRLGDYLAGTVAVSERAPLPPLDHIVAPPRLAAWLASADISPIPGPLLYRAVQALTTAHDRSPESRFERAVEIAEELNPYVAPAPPRGTYPEEFIAAVVSAVRYEAAQRAQRSRASVDRFRAQAAALAYGLRLEDSQYR